MSLSDLLRSARGAGQGSTQGQSAEISPIDRPAAGEGAVGHAGEAASSVAREIDVSHLPPPLPMIRILETLRGLGPGETLLVNHTRRPAHLYPKLDALGCTHQTTETSSGKIQVRITNPPTRQS